MTTGASNPGPGPVDATCLLQRLQQGDAAAADALLPLVYDQLRSLAGHYFRSQNPNHTLQPTALVHDAYLKLVQSDGQAWEGQSHFCAVAAKAMRQILSDHARAKGAAKRRAPGQRQSLTNIADPSGPRIIEFEELDEALTELVAIDERGAQIVELRFFGGLTNEQIAEAIGMSLSSVERSWRRSRAWLGMRLRTTEAEGLSE